MNMNDIWQAAYTAGAVLPKPVATTQYWHRSLNPKKLISVGFSRLQARHSWHVTFLSGVPSICSQVVLDNMCNNCQSQPLQTSPIWAVQYNSCTYSYTLHLNCCLGTYNSVTWLGFLGALLMCKVGMQCTAAAASVSMAQV